jgi:hypothetical protein
MSEYKHHLLGSIQFGGIMKFVLLALSLISFSSFAREWSCPAIHPLEGVSYKAICNFDKSVTLEKIRVTYNDKVHHLGRHYVYASAICNSFGMHAVDYESKRQLFETRLVGLKLTADNELQVTSNWLGGISMKSVTCRQ